MTSRTKVLWWLEQTKEHPLTTAGKSTGHTETSAGTAKSDRKAAVLLWQAPRPLKQDPFSTEADAITVFQTFVSKGAQGVSALSRSTFYSICWSLYLRG